MRNKLRKDDALSLLGINEKLLQELQERYWDFPEPWAGKYSFSDLHQIQQHLSDSGYATYSDFR